MAKMKLITITFHRSTGYSYETDSFQNLMSRVWNAFDKKRDELVRKYNGSTIIDSFVHNSRSDHDGEEGYFTETLRCPETDANDLIRHFASLDSSADVTHDKSEAVEYKKAKKLTEAQLVYRRYKGKLRFVIPSVKCYEQHFVKGEATEYVLCNQNAPITKATFLKIFDGLFSKYDDCPFEVAVRDKKFVSKPRKDAKLSWTYRTSLDYHTSIDNLKALLAYARRGAKFIDFYLGGWREGDKLYLSDEVKVGVIKEQLAETKAKLAK
jgi:hypothetical protein